MKKMREKVIAFLREPAVKTVIAILALLIAVGGSIIGWFTGFFAWVGRKIPWLIETYTWPNWLTASVLALLVICVVLVIWMIVHSDKKFKSSRRRKIRYHEIWNVLWGWPPIGNRFVGDGPLCPKHKLPVDIKTLESYREGDKFEFYCPGLEGEDGHIINGPKLSQLVGSQASERRDVNIYEDVNARIKAKELVEK